MSRLRACWNLLDRVGWVIALIFVAVAFAKLHNDEHAHNREARHTAIVQKAGEPTGVCLREAMRAGLPIVVRGADALEAQEAKAPPAARGEIALFVRFARSVEAPLREYVALQEHRYRGVSCPR
ncbi:MAG TPA: hypothetical protein VMB51_05190 [Solirubrobacteraceae bacterium]|nr:hypothetical protein [Solirubrobacteraceae bacterium]